MKKTWQLFLLLCLISCNSQKTIAPRAIGIGAGGSTIAPVVTSISPTSYGVKGGVPVTITGENFTEGASVIIGGSECSGVTVDSPTQITCTLTYHFALVTDVVVLNPNGISGTLFNGFSYDSFLYASNQSGGSALTRMRIDSSTGAITVLGTTATPNGSYGVEIDPTNSWVYTAGVSANQIAGFSIDHATGNLTAIPGTPIAAGAAVNGLAISSDSKCLIASNFSGGAGTKVTSFSINQTTGALTKVADYTGGTNPGGIAIDPQNRFVYVANYGSNNISGYTINTSTCSLVFINNYASGSSPDAISVHSNGKFVFTGNASASGGVTALSIDQSTGDLTLLNTYVTSNATNGSGVEIDKTGNQIYVTARGGGGAGLGKVWGYNINKTTGDLTVINSWATNDGPNDVRILGSGNFVFTANTESNTVTVLVRDLATGNLTPATPSYYTIGGSPGVIGITF
jgi:6-phosphogluconolactonase